MQWVRIHSGNSTADVDVYSTIMHLQYERLQQAHASADGPDHKSMPVIACMQAGDAKHIRSFLLNF